MKSNIWNILFLRKYLINIKFKVLKSAIAVFISIYIAKLLKMPDLLSPAFASVLCIQPTVFTGLKRGWQELFVSLLGAVLSVILVLPYGINLITIPITVAVTIYIAIKLNLDESIPIAIFTVLYITLFPLQSIWDTVKIRFLSILLGIGSASLVNYLISFIRYKYLFYTRMLRVSDIVYTKFSKLVEGIYDKDIELLNSLLIEIEQIFRQISNLKNEIKDLRREIAWRKHISGINETVAFYMERILANFEVIIHHTYDISRIYSESFSKEERIPYNLDTKFKELLGILSGFLRNLFKTLNLRDPSVLENREIKPQNFYTLMNQIKKLNDSKVHIHNIKLYSIVINMHNIYLSIIQLRRLIRLYLNEIKITR